MKAPKRTIISVFLLVDLLVFMIIAFQGELKNINNTDKLNRNNYITQNAANNEFDNLLISGDNVQNDTVLEENNLIASIEVKDDLIESGINNLDEDIDQNAETNSVLLDNENSEGISIENSILEANSTCDTSNTEELISGIENGDQSNTVSDSNNVINQNLDSYLEMEREQDIEWYPDNMLENNDLDNSDDVGIIKNQTENEAVVMPNLDIPGHKVEVIDGVTYIDNIMIVNKSYGLPQSYNPGGILPEVNAAFASMKSAAAEEGLNIYISSGFRTYERQVVLYNYYIRRDGKEKADTFSARPGFSEHQSGMCIDLNSISERFNNTRECQWVAEHAHEYGFIIRFPEGKEEITGYKYESWHLRYVGVEVATEIYENGLCLEEYLGVESVYLN